jgi:hypothetical protein
LASDAYNVIILAQSALMGGCSVGSLGSIIRSPNIPVNPSDELSFWASEHSTPLHSILDDRGRIGR